MAITKAEVVSKLEELSPDELLELNNDLLRTPEAQLLKASWFNVKNTVECAKWMIGNAMNK